MTAPTPEQRIRAYQARTNLLGGQVLLIYARCVLVRYLAENYFDSFILKGGALLHHVYGAPRVSYLDTDFADISRAVGDPDELERIMTFESPEDGFALSTLPDGRWQERGGVITGSKLAFTIDGMNIRTPKARQIKVSVAFRRGERLDNPDPQQPLFFDAQGLLAGDNLFMINGLTRNEIAAEKMLGWCAKEGLFKHLADLTVLARDHHEHLAPNRIADLIREKFKSERGTPGNRERYAALNLNTPSDLSRVFRDKLSPASLAGWSDQIGQTIWLQRDERNRAESVADVNTVVKYATYWQTILEQL